MAVGRTTILLIPLEEGEGGTAVAATPSAPAGGGNASLIKLAASCADVFGLRRSARAPPWPMVRLLQVEQFKDDGETRGVERPLDLCPGSLLDGAAARPRAVPCPR